MSAVVQNTTETRTTRLSALVSHTEADAIARRAASAGLSVSAYLREKALAPDAPAGDAAALRAVDALIDAMDARLDQAIDAVNATLARLDRE